jgi:hypothetical protein
MVLYLNVNTSNNNTFYFIFQSIQGKFSIVEPISSLPVLNKNLSQLRSQGGLNNLILVLHVHFKVILEWIVFIHLKGKFTAVKTNSNLPVVNKNLILLYMVHI